MLDAYLSMVLAEVLARAMHVYITHGEFSI